MGYYDAPTCRSTITWRRSSRSATAGSARCPAPRCPTACMPCAGWPLAAGMTGRPIYRPCITSPPSSGTSTLTTSPGAGIPSTPGRCAWPTSTTGWGTTTGSATSARPACRGRPFSTSPCNPKIPSFLEDAAAGTLRQVSWIDPAFTNFNPLGFPVNDDHPPADIKDGQDLVLAVYDALAASPQWDRSLLVIVYDENGGFYDHVPPPPAADDEPEMFGKLRRARASDHRLAVDRTAHRIAHLVRSHLDHQNDPVPLLPPSPAASRSRPKRRRARLGAEPAIPRLARGPGQSSWGTADTQHAATRPAAGHPRAASRGQGRPDGNQPAPARAPRRRRPSAQRPAEKHPCRDAQTEKGRAPTGRAIDGPRVRRLPGRRNGWLMDAAGTGSARVPDPWLGC